MKVDDSNQDILQNLEFSIVEVWRRHREMTDYVALRAYEAAFQHYRTESRGGVPKPTTLKGLDATAFEAVKTICEFRLGRSPQPDHVKNLIPPVPLETLLDCLRRLMRSVEFNTKTGGRQGYLNFIDRFLP